MKRSKEGFNGINFVDQEESKEKLKQKKLLNELLELQKDFVSKKRKLQAAKLKKENILGEILFLKQRRRYLLKSQSSNVDSGKNISHLKNHLDAESEVPKEERSNGGYDAAVESACPAFTSKFNLEHELGYEELLAGGDVLRMERVPNNYLIDDNNRAGKKKLSWHGQVTLKDSVSKKRKLQAAKLKKENILGEILHNNNKNNIPSGFPQMGYGKGKIFLKQRRRYLLKSQSSNVDSGKNISHLKNHLDAESEVPKEERSNGGYDAAVESACPAFTSKFNLEHELGYEDLLAGGDVLRMERVPKNYLIDDNNRAGKKKLSWHGQVTLKV